MRRMQAVRASLGGLPAWDGAWRKRRRGREAAADRGEGGHTEATKRPAAPTAENGSCTAAHFTGIAIERGDTDQGRDLAA